MGGTVGHRADAPIIIGVSQAMRDAIELADNVAASDCCVLIEGESGTGKELIARRVCAHSPRQNRPFIPVNCAGISASLFESQFFGHVRGAFTGAEQDMLGLIRAADGGTLFLDEVGEIPLGLQPKLLRAIQEQEVMPVGKPIPVAVNTRFIAGSNCNLQEMIRRGEFRRDLYYRLNIVRIVVPPLRDRSEDVPVLLDHFSSRYAAHYRRQTVVLGAKVRALLLGYPWPGNVRELAAWVERLYVTRLAPELLADMLIHDTGPQTPCPADGALSLKQVERRAIVQALEHSEHNQRKAARLLQVHRATLARKLRKHNLT